MWQRLALNLSLLLLISACSPSDKAAVDKLNSLSYACHYRDVDSTEIYANRALALSDHYEDGRAEALNNLAFVAIVRMDYPKAEGLLDEAIALTDNQVELLVSEVLHMRLCQRRSMNRAFYEHRERAVSYQKRINEERNTLSERLRQRMIYAESELAIVSSTYYYYVGLERQSIEALMEVNLDEVRHDTAQYLNYLYNVGAGGIITKGDAADIYQEEMDFLSRCLTISRRFNYPYFEANAKEALAEHDNDLQLADEALTGFKQFGDVYQIAGAYRTLASCYHALGDDMQALEHLHMALSDSAIYQAPDLVASIREQLSVAYSAINDKSESDYNRNIYIDLQEQTRQDRELEARAGILDASAKQLNWMIWAVVGAIVLLLFLLWLFNHLNKRRKEDRQLDDLLELKTDELRVSRLGVEKSERRHMEQRAKVSQVMSILPFIDRILYTIDHLPDDRQSPDFNAQLEYIRELTDKINEQNDLLTQWIQLRQGDLSLRIESFPLQPLFDIVAKGKTGFGMKGITLQVEPTASTVKADRVLTLFMLNTLADNARKFTGRGGQVTVSAEECDDYVELSVSDTGQGMTPEALAHVFDHKVSDTQNRSTEHGPSGHGFGLMNCKGIIEKYRKMSQLFSVCQIAAESEQGRGSRFFFRLPKGVVRLLAIGFWQLAFSSWLWASSLSANNNTLTATHSTLTATHSTLTATHSSLTENQSPNARAHIFADSAYFCNVNGQYERTLQFADSCRYYLNQQYLKHHPNGRLLLTRDGDTSVTPTEIQWLHDSVDVNYQVILDMRNESAVAALALHEWQLYAYNNKVYTQLFKELSADNTLGDYCRTMQQSQQNKHIAIILLLVIFLLILPAYYMLYYRHRLYYRHLQERHQLDNIEVIDDELRRAELEDSKLHVANAVLDNCLSALKHETMYYPSRIRQLVDTGDIGSLGEVTRYYRDLYGILSEQAMRQVEQVKLHVSKVEFHGQTLLGDDHMLRYLFELLKGDVTSEVRDDNYVVYHITNSQLSTVNSQQSTLNSQLSAAICRQIVRDHGEATHRRGCGISIDGNEVKLILPRYHGQV